MSPCDEVFSSFLGQMAKQVCLECLMAIYGTTDTDRTVTRLGALGDALETAEVACSNCERHATTYRMRR